MNTIPHPKSPYTWACPHCMTVLKNRKEYHDHLSGYHGIAPERKKYGSSDPLVRSVKRIRAHWRKTPLGRLRTLWEEESRWRRKMTIARNKHGKVLAKIAALAEELAQALTKEKGQE